MNYQLLLDTLASCYVYIPGLGKTAFSSLHIAKLPKHINVVSYTDTSMILLCNNVKYHLYRDDNSNCFVLDRM